MVHEGITFDHYNLEVPNTDQLEGLPAIAEAIGVSIQTARRRINSGLWSEVHKSEGRYGNTWTVDVPGLESIAEREGNEIDLREDQRTTNTPAVGEFRALMDDYKASIAATAEASAMVGVTKTERDRQIEIAKRLNSDLEQERAEVSRLGDELTSTHKDLAIATTQAEERQTLIGTQQAELIQLKQTVADAQAATARQQQQTQDLEASLGWLARRRYLKLTQG